MALDSVQGASVLTHAEEPTGPSNGFLGGLVSVLLADFSSFLLSRNMTANIANLTLTNTSDNCGDSGDLRKVSCVRSTEYRGHDGHDRQKCTVYRDRSKATPSRSSTIC